MIRPLLCCTLLSVVVALPGMAAAPQSSPSASSPESASTPSSYPRARNATDQPGNISGVWQAQFIRPNQASANTSSPPVHGPGELRTLEGEPVPLQPWAAALYSQRLKDDSAGTPFAGTMAQCLPQGMPGMAMNQPYPMQIIQSPGQVTTIHELMHSHRLIMLDQPLPEDPDPSYMGTSVGHWEGDTLVVKTAGIRDTTTMSGGIPHSDQLRVEERIRRLDNETLEVVMTLEDPKAYTKPWRVRGTLKLQPPDIRVMEYICENQRHTVDGQGHTIRKRPQSRQ